MTTVFFNQIINYMCTKYNLFQKIGHAEKINRKFIKKNISHCNKHL